MIAVVSISQTEITNHIFPIVMQIDVIILLLVAYRDNIYIDKPCHFWHLF